MPDDLSMSYSFQSGPAAPPPGPAAAAPLLAFTSCERVDLGDGSVLLLNSINGKQMTVSAEVATALTYCNSFKSLQEHAQALVDTIPQLQGQLANVTAVLELVNASGLMLDADAVCAQLDPAQVAPVSPAPTRVCIITCDRPAAVERLFDSMLRAGNLARHDALFLVDDSRDPDNGRQNRELVTKFNLTSARNMHYVGAAAQRQLLDKLIAANPDHAAAVRFLIDRERWVAQPSFGLARNLCLLLTAGYRCIVLDDDVLCSTVRPPVTGEGISFGGGSNRELACYSSVQELMQSALYDDIDPLRGHASCLGLPLAQAIGELDAGGINRDALYGGNAAMLNSLRADSPILVTQCGSWGDPGTSGTAWFFELGPESVQRLAAAPGGLAKARDRRHYWLGRSRPNVSKMAVMSQATGLDNSHLLPPYFPVFRGEDYLFASMLLFLHPDSAVLDYAWSIPHLPLEQRGGTGATDSIASRGGLGLCARYLADRAEYAPGISPETRLHKLAAVLRELSEQSPTSLLALFRAELAREHAGQLQKLQQQLQRTTAPDWQDYLQQGITEVSGALQTPASPTAIADVPADWSDDDLLLRAKAALAEFSAAIQAWPELRESATVISSQMLASGNLSP